MIDLHVHLLPGVDDGPPDLDSALTLARALVDAGMRRALVTPHINEWTAALLPDRQEVVRRTLTLQSALTAALVPLQIEPGGECYLYPDLPDQAHSGVLPVWGATPCLLVELARSQPMLYAGRVISDLLGMGIRVVLAHPERYAFVQARPAALEPWIAMGVLMQVTAQAFFGDGHMPVTRTAIALLRRGMVHLVASDAHHAGAVPLHLAGLGRIRALAGEGALELLTAANPAALLEGRPLEPVVVERLGWHRYLPMRFGR